MRCKICGAQMVKTMHFDKDKSYQYYFCNKCFFKTHNKSIDYKRKDWGTKNAHR